MFHLNDVLLLQPDERVKTIARRHVVTLVPNLVLALAFIVLPFFLLFPLFRWGVWGVVLFLILVSFGVLLALRTLLLWDADVFILTSRRVVDVDQRGLFTRIVSEAPLDSIQEVSWSMRGMLESFFRMGSVKLQLTSGATTLEARRVPHPDALQIILAELRSAVGRKPGESGRQEREGEEDVDDRLNRIVSLLKTFSDDELLRIETVLNARGKSFSEPSP